MLVAMFAVASCQGIQERVDVLRAKKIEIIGDDDKAKMDLESEVRELRDRVAKLEQLVKTPPAPAPAMPATADAGARAPLPLDRR